MKSSAKTLLQKNKEKRSQKEIDKHIEWADQNLKTIQQTLRNHRGSDHKEIYEAVVACLNSAKSLSSLKLELPAMTPALSSTILYNMALWIGNTDTATKLQENALLKRD